MSRFEVGTISDRGLSPRRPINEDRFLTVAEHGLFLVADGVGGEMAGEIASQAVVDTFAEAIRHYPGPDYQDLREFLAETIAQVNAQIYQAGQNSREQTGMATTLALISITKDQAVIAHVGDSRVYSLSGKKLVRETRDHNDLEDAVRAGLISEAEANRSLKSNIINRAVGAERDVEPEFKYINIDHIDLILLCTDGITRHISDDELREILLSDRTPQQMCEVMKQRCHARGAEDNLTVVVVKMVREDEERTLQPMRERKQKQASRISVPVGAYAPDEFAQTGSAYESAEHSGKNLVKTAVKMLLFALMLAGAFYGGLYVGRNHFAPVPATSSNNRTLDNSANNPSIDDEAKEWNYLTTGSQSNVEFKRALDTFTAGKHVEALKQFQELVNRADKPPAAARYQYWLARCYFALNNYDQALIAFQKAIDLNIGVPSAYLYQARCYQALGQEQFKRFNEKRKEFAEREAKRF